MDLRPVLFLNGLMLNGLAAFLIPCLLADLSLGDGDWAAFLVALLITVFVGTTLVLSYRAPITRLSLRQAFLLTSSCWVVLSTFATLPMLLSYTPLGFGDAFFEAVSGITTTGATVIADLDSASGGILLWRSILQWIGGIGIVVTAIAVLPLLQVGGMQIFKMESSERSEKALPRAAQITAGIAYIYLAMTGGLWILYMTAGLTPFDAINHAMTTIATGGFSTQDASLGAYDSWQVEAVAVGGMLLAALPFTLYLRFLRGDSRALFTDAQVRGFLAFAVAVVAVMMGYLIIVNQEGFGDALRLASFNVVSILTGTGYASDDYGAWGSFSVGVFFFIAVVGGCAGSTSCGIKIFRFQVLATVTHVQMQRLLKPNGVFLPNYNGRRLDDAVTNAVLGFFFMFAVVFSILAIALIMVGLDFLTAMSAAASAIANVGPGLGDIVGPAGNYQSLPSEAKWVLCVGMILGRLELFTVLVLLLPSFWRR